MAKILIVDDEKSIREALSDILKEENYEVLTAEDGEDAWDKLNDQKIDLVLCDIKMPKMDGMELLTKVSEEGLDIPFVMISAHGSIDTAVEATKKGAYDFIQKPPDLNRILLTVRNGVQSGKLSAETKVLKKKVKKGSEMIGDSQPLLEVKETIEKVAPTDARVLITGSNGTGKELVARWLHEKSERSKSGLIEVNCAAIPSELIESELFGHEKGSFTSAHKQRIGKFEQAQGGTLFLDEIGDMSLSAQAKVLRALQDKKITRVGGDKSINVDVRVLAATNKDLKKAIEAGDFREDLYHRLSVVIIQVPDLKDRREDIPLLIEYFLGQVADDYGASPKEIEPDGITELKKQDWTGNIRELRNVVERLVILSDAKITKLDVQKNIGY
ncbi:MAG: sigma-54 dependent transcriptional regulator [Bacteroidota bacterium]